MKIRIKDGTPKSGGPGLCHTCDSSIIREYDDGSTVVLCAFYGTECYRRVLRPVVRCNVWEEKGAKSVSDYEKSAWILRTEKGGRSIGFTPYRDLSKKEQEKVDEEMEHW